MRKRCIRCHGLNYLLLPASSHCVTIPYAWEVFQTMLLFFFVCLQLMSSPIQTVVPAVMLVVMLLLAVLEECNSVRSIEECFLI